MNKSIFKISAAFEDIMPSEYKELIAKGPYGNSVGISDLGTFKELLEEHPPMCWLWVGIVFAADTGVPAKPGGYHYCRIHGMQRDGLSASSVALYRFFFGNKNAVASGLKRALYPRFPDKVKDVQIFTPCPTNLKFPPDQTINVAREAGKSYYTYEEFQTPEAAAYFKKLSSAF